MPTSGPVPAGEAGGGGSGMAAECIAVVTAADDRGNASGVTAMDAAGLLSFCCC